MSDETDIDAGDAPVAPAAPPVVYPAASYADPSTLAPGAPAPRKRHRWYHTVIAVAIVLAIFGVGVGVGFGFARRGMARAQRAGFAAAQGYRGGARAQGPRGWNGSTPGAGQGGFVPGGRG